MKRLSGHTTRILSLSLVVIMLAVTLLSTLLVVSNPLPAQAATFQQSFRSTTTWTVPTGVTSVTVLVVAGGGGGAGGSTTGVSGGGGAGGVNYQASFTVAAGASITITIGASGAGGAYGGNNGSTGGNSSFGSSTYGYVNATGGGGGGYSNKNGAPGGSGGGGGADSGGVIGNGGSSNTSGQGYAGGNGATGGGQGGGGGGGSSHIGYDGTGTPAAGGNGGAGTSYVSQFSGNTSIGGVSGVFAGGGGGGVTSTGTAGTGGSGGGGNGGKATAGSAATGNGSGGGGGGPFSAGGAGSKGIVVVQYTPSTSVNYNLTVANTVGGNVPVPGLGNHSYANGTVVPINATANSSCYAFVNWTGTNISSIPNVNLANTTIIMTNNSSITANFRYNCYNLTTSAGSGGTVTTPGAGTYTYANGTVVSIVATPSSCNSFNNWSGDTGTIANVISSSTTINMSGNYSIQANFATNTSILTVTPNNSGGSPYFDGSNPFTCGATVSIYANNSSSYVFAGWTPTNGIANPSAANTSVNMTQGRDLTASYTALPTPTPSPTPTPTGNITTTTYLSWHITCNNFSLSKTTRYIVANISAGVSGSMGKYIGKQLTIYIKQRPVLSGIGRGGIWGDNAIIGLGSLSLSGQYSLFNGDLYVNGSVSVTASGNMVSGTLYCNNLSAPADFYCANNGSANCSPVIPCPNQSFPTIGVPQDYFKTNLSTGTQDWNQADVDHEYVFNSSVSLTSNTHVYNTITHRLKPGYYYSNGTITLSGHAIRGAVTFIAKQIIINNDDTASNGSGYIGLQPYDENNLLLWATGNSGNDIWITEVADARYHPCVELEGILYAPNGEVQLDGSGSNPSSYGLPLPSTKAIIHNGGIRTQNLSITGHDWWFYRW